MHAEAYAEKHKAFLESSPQDPEQAILDEQNGSHKDQVSNKQSTDDRRQGPRAHKAQVRD